MPKRLLTRRRRRALAGGTHDTANEHREPSSRDERQGPSWDERQGPLDRARAQLSDLGAAATTVGLKVLGLQRVPAEPANEDNEKNDQTANEANAALAPVEQGVDNAARNAAALATHAAHAFNAAMDDPAAKAELDRAAHNAGELAAIVVDAGREPFNKAVDAASEAVPKMMSAAASGAVRVGTDVAAAVPGIGAIIDLGKAANDVAKTASSINEHVGRLSDEVSGTLTDLASNVRHELDKPEHAHLKALAARQAIAARTQASAQAHATMSGGTSRRLRAKTRRWFKKRRTDQHGT